MDLVAPSGPVYQAGTLSGNPLAMAAGLATLRAAANRASTSGSRSSGGAGARGMDEAAFAGGARSR